MTQSHVQQRAMQLCEVHTLGKLEDERSGYPWYQAFLFVLLFGVLIELSSFIGPFMSEFICYFLWCLFCIGMYGCIRLYRDRCSTDFLYENGLVLVQCKGRRIIDAKAICWRDILSITRWTEYPFDAEPGGSGRYAGYTIRYRIGERFDTVSEGEWASGRSLGEEIARRSRKSIIHGICRTPHNYNKN